MTQLLIDRATLEQMVDALENSIDDVRTYLADAEQLAGYQRYDRRIAAYKAQVGAHEAAITAGRAALANAEPTGFSLTNTSISDTSRTIESFFEAMDKEVAAGRLVRTGPMEWTKL